MSLFNKLMDEIDQYGDRHIALHKDGEPLLHPDICTILQRVKQNQNHTVYLTTNAHRLTPIIAKEIINNKMKKVGLFGSKSTMSNGFYQKVAEKYNINIVIPKSDKQEFIHTKYMSELIYNKIFPDTKQQLIQIVMELLQTESIEGLILGGTELPLILDQSDFEDLIIFDTTKIHVDSIIRTMTEE